MPLGFKLESEEFLLKEEEGRIKPPIHKKHKKVFSFGSDYPKERRNKIPSIQKQLEVNEIYIDEFTELKTKRNRELVIKDQIENDGKNEINSNTNTQKNEVMKKCQKGIAKLKQSSYAEYFCYPPFANAPSLLKIEKNIKDYKYKTTYDFIMELRKMWNYFFTTYSTNPEIYQRICKMSKLSEEIYKDLEDDYTQPDEYGEITQKIDSLTKVVRTIQEKNKVTSNHPLNKTSIQNQSEKPMSFKEKNLLKENIEKLTQTQILGLIQILSDVIDIKNKKYLEFDFKVLPNKKLREMERYVKKCLKKDGRHISNEKSRIEKLKSDLNGNNNQKLLNNNSTNATQSTQSGVISNNRNNFNQIGERASFSSYDSGSSNLSSLEKQ